jgi:hypothetical protein
VQINYDIIMQKCEELEAAGVLGEQAAAKVVT